VIGNDGGGSKKKCGVRVAGHSNDVVQYCDGYGSVGELELRSEGTKKSVVKPKTSHKI